MRKGIGLFTTLMVCMAMALCVSCKKDNAEPGGGNTGGGGTQTVATVTTAEVTEITKTTAVCGGEVKSENGWAVTERGVCWGVEPNPTPSDNCTVDGEGVGAFTSEITGLEPDTKYYVRAYAKNAAGTGFGEQRSFTTQGTGGGGGGTQTVATVTTGVVTEITQTTATCGGEVTSDGGAAVTACGVCWSTSQNPTVSDSHTTDGSGTGSFTSNITGLTENTTYYVRAYATNSEGTSYGEQRSFTTDGGTIAGHEYVDLGLPSTLLWATCNVGADSPEDYGDYFAWGETETKDYYDWITYKWCNGDWDNLMLTKYCTDSDYGTVDNKTVLDPEDDAARANWGGGWRMPTSAEWQELYDNTNSEWTGNYHSTGVAGRIFTSKTDGSKYIFLPAAGIRNGTSLYTAGSYGYYWSSSLYSSYPYYACYMYFGSGNVYPQFVHNRYYGYSVRPVR